MACSPRRRELCHFGAHDPTDDGELRRDFFLANALGEDVGEDPSGGTTAGASVPLAVALRARALLVLAELLDAAEAPLASPAAAAVTAVTASVVRIAGAHMYQLSRCGRSWVSVALGIAGEVVPQSQLDFTRACVEALVGALRRALKRVGDSALQAQAAQAIAFSPDIVVRA